MTNELRLKLKELLDSKIQELPNLLESFEGKERLEMIFKLMQYTLPKVKEIDFQEGEPIQW